MGYDGLKHRAKYEYCVKCSQWFPHRGHYPWCRIRKWVPSRIEHSCAHGYDVDIDNYTLYVTRKPRERSIFLVLNGLRIEEEDGEIAYSPDIQRIEDSEFRTAFLKEQLAIEQAFLKETRKVARNARTKASE